MFRIRWPAKASGMAIEELRRENQQLRQALQAALARIQELEEELARWRRDSQSSSKPPSSDGPRAEQRIHPQRKAGQRHPGGQPGHRGVSRALVPVDQVQKVELVRPKSCVHCGASFQGQEPAILASRHQVTELPLAPAEVSECQCLSVDCPRCGKRSTAEVPAAYRKPFGPQLIALIAYLTVQGRMPRRIIEQLLRTVLGVPISLGRVQQAVEEAGTAVAASCEELQQQLPKQPALNVDETGWKTSGKRRWMWVFVAAQFAYYWVDASRAKKVLELLLGPVFRGILCTDRWAVYLSYHQGSAQLCWAHLKRDLLGIVEVLHAPTAQEFAREALGEVARLFRLWHRYRGNGLSRAQFVERAIPVGKKLFRLAESHINAKEGEVRALARVLFLQTEKLFTFVTEPGVEPTNNAAERALRPSVQWRKISFGNRSKSGELATARLLTVLRTCSMQGRNPYQFLLEAMRCHRFGLPTPSLLPQTT